MTSSKNVCANYDQLAPNSDMAFKTIQCVSVPNLKLFGPRKTELQAKKFGKFSIMLYGKWAGRHSFAHHHGCRNVNVWRFPKIWTAVIDDYAKDGGPEVV